MCRAHTPSSEEDDMSPRKIAIAGSIAALSLAAVPFAQAASMPHHNQSLESRLDRSRDPAGSHHADRTQDAPRDTRSVDTSTDVRGT
jgi:hypothetical protein